MKLFSRFFKKKKDEAVVTMDSLWQNQRLRSSQFRKGREKLWRELEELVTRVEKKGLRALSAEEAQKLPLLYRAGVSSLSIARTIVLDRNVLLYLENLSLRAYLAVYGPRRGLWSSFKQFIKRDFPRAVREMWPHLLVVTLIFFVSAMVAYWLVLGDLSLFHTFVPEALAGGRGPDSSVAELREQELFSPWGGFSKMFLFFGNFLFRHNTLIGILCFGLGFVVGIPTILLLISNGLTIGAFVALHAHKKLTVDFVGWLSIHGVTEILAILLCAAAGLVVAEKIIFPGDGARLHNLASHGRRAASIVAGAVGLFFIASVLEGGFRQLINNTPGRYGVALLTAVFWIGYFTLAGRKRDVV